MISGGIARIGFGLTIWLVGTLLVLATIDLLSVERVFVSALAGFLAVRELTPAETIDRQWRIALNWLLVAGLAVFGVLVALRVLAVL